MNEHVLLEVENLHVRYVTDEQEVYAVNGISFTLNRGETMGLVGETGAGKTTTALSIMKLLPRFTAKVPHGSICFNGTNILEAEEEKMLKIRGGQISMIFQDPMTSLNPVFSVRDQISEVLMLHRPKLKKEELEGEVGRLLELVGIPAFRMNDYPHQFSGGMKQRVCIAIAIACDPELLIADEPTTALDVTIQAQVLNMMRELREKMNSSLLIITHDLGVVASICDTVGIMYAGELVEYGTLEDIFSTEKKRHPYTEGLFASIPDLHTQSARLTPIEGLMPDPTELPAGCKFHPRCKYCTEDCRSGEIPNMKRGRHIVKCNRYDAEQI